MWSALPLWILLNAYAFLLDALAILAGGTAWFVFLSGHPVWGWLAVATAAILGGIGLRVHLSYPQKLRAYKTLLRRNRGEFRPKSFYEFMGAPCYRLVVRTVLMHIGHADAYPAIYRDCWGEGLCCYAEMPSQVNIFNDRGKAREWIEDQKFPPSEMSGGFPAAETPAGGGPEDAGSAENA